jgi:hypothetical protein
MAVATSSDSANDADEIEPCDFIRHPWSLLVTWGPVTFVNLGSRRIRNHHCLYMNRMWHGEIAGGLALRSRCRYSATATFARHLFRQIPHAFCGLNPVWRGKRKASGIGPVLAMNGFEMKATQQFDRLGQNCRPETITRDLLSNPTRVAHNDELAETFLATVIQIGCQEKSL